MPKLNPYLQFEGDAREAMTFYRDVFGGELTISTFGDFGADQHDGAALPADGVMHGQLETAHGMTLMGSDLPPGQSAATPNGHLCLSGDEAALLTGWFEALSEGGHVDVPLERQVWGDLYGQVKDRFGVNWMFNVGSQG